MQSAALADLARRLQPSLIADLKNHGVNIIAYLSSCIHQLCSSPVLVLSEMFNFAQREGGAKIYDSFGREETSMPRPVPAAAKPNSPAGSEFQRMVW